MTLKRLLKIVSIFFLLAVIILASLGYLFYSDLRNRLISNISAASHSYIGQKVEIRALSLSPTGVINLYGIRVQNPEGFAPGQLLQIKRLYLSIRLRELFRQRLSFKEITVYSPELTLRSNEKGRLNISNQLMQLLSRKTSLKYQVDEFSINSGGIDFNGDKKYRNDDISLYLKNISSDPSVRTSINAKTTYAGESTIYVSGWAYPGDPQKKLNISVSSRDLTGPVLKAFLNKHGIDAEKTKVAFKFDAEGDMGKGFRFGSETKIKSSGLFAVFKKDAEDILLDMSAFLSMQDSKLLIGGISLHVGNSTAATLRGEIRNIFKEPFYAGELRIDNFDLSSFDFLRGLRINGIITSNNLHVQGDFKPLLPEISGDIDLKDGALVSKTDDIEKIQASLKFMSKGAMRIKAAATAEVSKAHGYSFDRPADLDLSLTAFGTPGNMSLTSSLYLSPVETHLKGDKKVSLDSIGVMVDVNVKDDALSGKSRMEMKNLNFDGYRLAWLRQLSPFKLKEKVFYAISPVVEGEGFKTSADRVSVRLPGKEKGMAIDVEGLNVSYPGIEAGLSKGNLSLHLATKGDFPSGDFKFALDGILFKGIHATVAGSGGFDEKDFSFDVPRAALSSGDAKLTVTGRTRGGPFPVKISAKAEGLDIGEFSHEMSKISGMLFDLSGSLKTATFEGTLNSAESIQGRAEMRAEKIALRKKGSKESLLNDVLFMGAMEFKGKDVDFRTQLNAGNVAADISGTMRNLTLEKRAAEVRVKLPGTKVADIRESLWDLFPDSLLYAGLEGSLSTDLSIDYSVKDLKVNGSLALQDITLQGENNEYSVGPVNGVLPIAYSKTGGKNGMIDLPSFDPSELGKVRKYYAQKKWEQGYNRITAGSLHYGFKFVEGIDLRVKQEGTVLNIAHFGGTIFGGRLDGTAIIDFSKGLSYRTGMILEGLSMTKLCDNVEPIKGYISGKLDGTALLKGSGPGISRVIGKADFRTYSTEDEITKVSEEFLKKMGGASLKAYRGDKRFDKGEMSLFFQDGFVIFRNLEISHKNIFGMQDLSIKVAPFNNRIAIDHLMWSITEAAQRAREK